jgi:hypothetical protein
MALVLATAGGALAGCGSSQPKFNIGQKVGEMPTGESWAGVYYNPIYGNLHMVDQGDSIVGKWQRTDKSHWGELSGKIEGDVMHFEWKEHQYGALGPNSEVKGEGVFVYKKNGDNPPELEGRYSLADSASVGEWHCIKQVNVKPDPNSITGDNPTDAPTSGDKWQ